MNRRRLDQIGYAMLTVIRQDQDDLRREGRDVRAYDPHLFDKWVGEFIDDPGLLRKAPAYEVAALLRAVHANSDWFDPEEGRLERLQDNVSRVLPNLDLDAVMNDDDRFVVEEVRQAQNSTLDWCRKSLMDSLDRAVVCSHENGTELAAELAQQLAKRGWLQEPDPSERPEQVLRAQRSSPADRESHMETDRNPGRVRLF